MNAFEAKGARLKLDNSHQGLIDQTEMNRQTMCIAGMSVFQEGETVSAKVLR